MSSFQQTQKEGYAGYLDDNDQETSNEEESHEVSNLALTVIEEESCDERDEVSDLPSYDDLYEAFKELHNDLKNIGIKNVSLRKKNAKLSSENESLNAKVKNLELENKELHNEIISCKESIAFEHEGLLVDNLKNENETLKKKNSELNDIVLKFTDGQNNLEK